jgi:hypothetical protein
MSTVELCLQCPKPLGVGDDFLCQGCMAAADPVNSPGHYTWLGGIEVIDITEHFSFTMGNVLKYVMRADHKGKPVEDLLKARYYLNRELKRRGHVD